MSKTARCIVSRHAKTSNYILTLAKITMFPNITFCVSQKGTETSVQYVHLQIQQL
jgi:hypothetical protein